jgi:hypothetical protein
MDIPDTVIGEPEQGATPSGSLMEKLRSKHAEIASKKTIDIPLPGYDDMLITRYRVLDVRNDINRISQRVQKERGSQLSQALSAAMDSMIASCVEIFTTRDGQLVPLSESFGPDHPAVRYDESLAEFMDFKIDSARDLILQLFGGNEPMIMDHAQMLSRWMSDTTREVNDEFLGER